MRELIPGEDDQSVYEIFFLLTQSGNGRDQGTLLGVLYRKRSTSVVWRRAWQRRKLGGANHLTLSVVELHPMCVGDISDERYLGGWRRMCERHGGRKGGFGSVKGVL